jgi:hypothetical protein
MLNILFCQSRCIMLVFWVNRAVCCNPVSIVECKKSYSVFSRSINIISIHSRDPEFQNNVTVRNIYATIQLWFWPGQLSQYTTKLFVPSCMTVKKVSRQEAISLTPHLPRVSSSFLFPNNTHCEIKFLQLPLTKHCYHTEGLTKTLLPDQNYKLHRPWYLSSQHLSSLLLLLLLFSSGEAGSTSS